LRTKAIILKKQNTGEYDQLVICYTQEFGKVLAIAKSILKPNSIQAMHLDVFNLVGFELINGRATPIIAGAQAENLFGGIKSDLVRLSAAYLFTEIIDKLAFEYQKDESLWDFLLTTLDKLDVGQNYLKEFIRERQVEFLNILGYAPNLNDCAFCGRSNLVGSVAYNAQARGIVCKDCFLGGQGGIVIKDKDWLSGSVLDNIFESLAERKINSLNLVRSMLQ